MLDLKHAKIFLKLTLNIYNIENDIQDLILLLNTYHKIATV